MHQTPPTEPPEPGCFSLRQAVLCGLLAVLLDLAVGLHRLSALVSGALVNPDSYMRLVRLDDILAAHAPVDVITRDASGAGTVLHWSHLLDSILLLLAVPLAPLLGMHDALRWVGIAMGPLTAGLLGVALAWLAAPLSDPDWRFTAPLIGMLAVPIVGYAIPGVVHHHILLALVGVMCAGWAARTGELGKVAGWRVGAWAAFGLWLSPEGLAVALMAFGGIGVGWLTHPRRAEYGLGLAYATTTMAGISTLALLVDPPPAGLLSIQIDRMSIVFICLGLFAAGVGWSLHLIDRAGLPPGRRAAWGGLAIVLAAAVWLMLFPSVLTTPEGMLNEQYAHAFDGITEMLPVASFADAMQYLLTGSLAAVVAIGFAMRRRSAEFAYVAACVLLLLAAAALHRRFSTYAACAGAAAVPVAITLISHRLADRSVVAASLRLLLLLVVILAPVVPAAIGAKPTPTDECKLQQVVPMLRLFPGEVVLADVNDTPELLYRTDLRTVGSLYRNIEGFLRLRAAWRSRQLEDVPQAVTAAGATLVLFCRHAGRTALVGDLPEDTLWDRLRRDAPPAWLRELPVDPGSGFRLYHLDRFIGDPRLTGTDTASIAAVASAVNV